MIILEQVELVEIYISDFMTEEIIGYNDKLKIYSKYKDKDETKKSLLDRVEEIAQEIVDKDLTLSTGDSLIKNIKTHSSDKKGLSTYINLEFNLPDEIYSGNLALLDIRISDHNPKQYMPHTETLYIDGRTLNKIKEKIFSIIEDRKNKIEKRIKALQPV